MGSLDFLCKDIRCTIVHKIFSLSDFELSSTNHRGRKVVVLFAIVSERGCEKGILDNPIRAAGGCINVLSKSGASERYSYD